MKARVIAALRNLLLIWGALSLCGVIALGAYVTYWWRASNREQIDSASASDVAYVLNWCGLGADRIDNVTRSYVSARSPTGDHLDAYAIRVSRIEAAELTARDRRSPGEWYRGDRLPPVVSDALGFIAGSLDDDKVAWFPREAELRSENVFVYPWAIRFHGITPTAVDLIFARPLDHMIFYFSEKI